MDFFYIRFPMPPFPKAINGNGAGRTEGIFRPAPRAICRPACEANVSRADVQQFVESCLLIAISAKVKHIGRYYLSRASKISIFARRCDLQYKPTFFTRHDALSKKQDQLLLFF
jgi:hypothetical protein